MPFPTSPALRLLLLVALASALALAVLVVDTQRRDLAARDAVVTGEPVPDDPVSSDPVAAATNPPGQLVAASPAAAGTDVGAAGEPAVDPGPVEVPVVQRRGDVVCSAPHRTARITAATPIRATPGGRVLGELPASSIYLRQQVTAWVQAVTPDGAWGRVTIPWRKPVGRAGWIALDGATVRSTTTLLVSDLSDRRLRVYRGCDELFSVPTAIGRPGSPSPKGRFWVSDRIAVPAVQQGSFGTYAFGLSTVQPNLPAGWTGGDQMAIHGTGSPGSIGEAASAGCLRVDERALARLKPLLRIGTPVVIQA